MTTKKSYSVIEIMLALMISLCIGTLVYQNLPREQRVSIDDSCIVTQQYGDKVYSYHANLISSIVEDPRKSEGNIKVVSHAAPKTAVVTFTKPEMRDFISKFKSCSGFLIQ